MSVLSRFKPAKAEDDAPPSAWVQGLCMGALLALIFLAALDMSIVSTAIPAITTDFHDLTDVGWYGSAFFLTTAVFQPFWGKLMIYLNHKYVLIAALVVFELGSLACAVAKNSPGFIAGRAVAGCGAGGIATGVYAIISHIVKPETLPTFYGIVGFAYAVAGVFGPLVGGAFTSNVTWRWCFWINLPIGGAAGIILLVFLTLPLTARPRKVGMVEFLLNLDFPGTITILGSLLCLIFALELGGIRYPWSHSSVIGTLIGWILLALIAVGIEYVQGNRAILPGRLMKQWGIAACCAFIFTLEAATIYRIYFLPIQFQAVYGVSAIRSGVLLLPLLLMTALFAVVAGVLLAKFGYYQPFLLIGTALAAVGTGLIYTLDLDSSLGKIVGYQILIGFADGLVVQTPLTAVQAFVSAEDITTVTAMILFWQLCGGAVGITAGQSIFSNRLLQVLPRYAPNIDPAFIVQAGAYTVAQDVPAESLQGVREAYLVSLRDGWIITIAFCGAAFLIALAVPPISIIGRVGAQKMALAATADLQSETPSSKTDEKTDNVADKAEEEAV